MSTTDGWFKLNYASCVIRQICLVGVLMLFICLICNMVFVNHLYDMVVGTQFHTLYGRPSARVV